jgi:ssDNA-binding Zn-finger/Zn-ribbon topoisomerase 1
MNPEDKYLDGIDLSTLPAQAREVLIAIGQYHVGEQITAKCPKCQKILAIREKGFAWFISCDCGFCEDICRGLLKPKLD